MDYSDENLYKELLSLSHSLRHSQRRGPSGFPPHGGSDPREHFFPQNGDDPRERFFPRGGACPNNREEPAHGRHGHPCMHRPHFSDDRRPPLARERILRLIGETEPVSQAILAEHLAIRPQSLSEQLAKLENDGLILREASEQDKRVTLVSLTESGRQRMREVETARAEQITAFLAPLSLEERKQLFLLLQKLSIRA